MGGNLESRVGAVARRRSATLLLAVAGVLGVAVAACDSDDDPAPGSTVGAADAITAIVAWQAGEQEPVLDEDGEPQLPVIFVVADDSTTIDVGVQAAVAEATADWATVRFADGVSDAFDPGLEGEPVRDDGALLLLGPIPEPERQIEMDLARYTTVDDSELFTVEITRETTPNTGTGPDPAPPATVTSVTQL